MPASVLDLDEKDEKQERNRGQVKRIDCSVKREKCEMESRKVAERTDQLVQNWSAYLILRIFKVCPKEEGQQGC